MTIHALRLSVILTVALSAFSARSAFIPGHTDVRFQAGNAVLLPGGGELQSPSFQQPSNSVQFGRDALGPLLGFGVIAHERFEQHPIDEVPER